MNSGVASATQLLWDPLLPVSGLLVVLAAGVLLLVLSWHGSRGVVPRRRWALLLLRLSVLLGLGFVLAGPQSVEIEERGQREVVAIVLDSSRSMEVEDTTRGSRAAAVGAWLEERQEDFEELQREFDLQFFLLGEELRPWSDGSAVGSRAQADGGVSGPTSASTLGLYSGGPIPADESATDLGAGLYGLRSAVGGRRPAGVLLVSDGADRAALGRAAKAGEAAAIATFLEDFDSPVSTWTVGDTEELSDLSLAEVHAPPFGFVRRPLTVDVEVRRSGLPDEQVSVQLLGEGTVIAVKDVALDSDGEGLVQFELRPDRIGYHSYRLVTEVPRDDVVPSNNQIEFTVKVVRDRTRVLQVTSRPSWDVKFLRRLLKTDPNIDLVSFFILRTSDYEGDLARREPLSLIAFPYEDLFSQDLQGFDLVVLQNFWFGSFANFSDDQFLKNLADFVEQGGALMMVGGDITGEADYGQSPLSRVLPSVLPRSSWDGSDRRPQVTEAGLRHPVTRLDRDGASNQQRWDQIPALTGHNSAGATVEGGITLLTTGPENDPLLTVRSVGRGRTLLFSSDSSWRWALAHVDGGGAGRDHSIFWRNSLRWLVKDAEERQVQVVTDRENYQVGEEVAVQVRVLDADYSPKVGEPVRVVAKAVGSEVLLLETDSVTDDAGQVSLQLEATRAGTHAIEAEVSSIGEPFGRAEARISVHDREGELEDPRTQVELMTALAETTGGRVLKGGSPDPNGMVVEPRQLMFTREQRSRPLWDRPWILFLLGLPLGVEWVLRRRSGLA